MSGRIVWSEAARALFDLTGPTAVSAGAGSGKTTCLVELCLRLFAGEATGTPCEPAEVVAITFTEKAALELEERLRAGVAARAAAGGEAARAWRERLHALDRMAIGTIHGFAGRLLREHALEAGVDPEFQVADEETAQAWRRQAALGAVVAALDAGRPAARALAAVHRAGGLADLLVELQRERATLGDDRPPAPAPDGEEEARAARARLLAAARSVLAARAQVRTASGQTALARLAEAVGALAPEDAEGPLTAGGLERLARLGPALSGWRVGSSDGEGARALKEAVAAAAEAFAPAAAEVLAGPQKRELCALLAEAERRYAERKRAARALDFDDLLLRARDLLRAPAVRAPLRARLRALLVDEYQDVNALQQELFELLAAGPGPGPLRVAVGDLKQSIYRFRGADVAVFRETLARLAAAPPGRALHLSENHRSSAAVLELVNEVFARCMQPAGGAPRPYELAFGPEDRLEARRPGGQRPACELLVDGEGGSAEARRPREARAIAERIRALVSGAAGVEVRERAGEGERARRPRFGDVAILFRRLTQLAPYERALREAGVPYRLARGGGFYQAPEVRDLGELATSLAAPEDALAWAALLRSPLCGLSEGGLLALARAGLPSLARRPPAEAARLLVETWPGAAAPWPPPPPGQPGSSEAGRLERFLAAWQSLWPLVGRLRVDALLARAVDALDLEAAHLAAPDGERRLANLRKALALAARWAEAGETAAGLGARLRALAGRPPREPEADLEPGDAVALLTVHQAKGLEWPVVFVPDLGATAPSDTRRALRDPAGAVAAAFCDPEADRALPTTALLAAREEARRAGAAEARRLLYVALTRARDRLVLSGEAGRGESWRGMVEAALAARPDLAVRVPLAEAASLAVGAAVGEDAAGAPAVGSVTGTGAGAGAGAGERASVERASAVRIAVTALSEHARCPRRVWLGRYLGLPEQGAGGGGVLDDPDRATARGTLAHAMIAEADLGAPPLERRARLAAAAARRGYAPEAAGVRRILADVTRFLDAPAGQRLAQAARAGRLRREAPFLLRLPAEGSGEGPACYLVGALDALVEPAGPRDPVEVIDYKYALPRPEAAERYRLQLLAYALAAGRAFPGRRVVASLQFLRGSCARLDVTPAAADLRRFAAEAPRLAAAAAAGQGLRASPAELGRDEARCRAEGCGFVARCYAPTPGVRSSHFTLSAKV